MRIFVYGSLKRGFRLHYILADQRFVGDAITAPGFRLYDVGAFPAMVADPDGIAVQGELYEVDDDCLAELDRVEGEGRLYERVEIKLQGQSTAETYLFLPDVDKLEEIGDCWK